MNETGPQWQDRTSRLRAFTVIALLAGVLTVVLMAIAPSLASALARVDTPASDGVELQELVVAAAYLLVVVAAVMLALGGVATALPAAGLGSDSRVLARCVRLAPMTIRRLVLVGCGTALTLPMGSGFAQATIAGHDPMSSSVRTDADLSGLALPDLPTGPRHAPVVRVRAGDSLWSIAAELLGPEATSAQIARRVDSLHQSNRHQIGADPDLILPGTELTLRRNR